MSENDDHNYQVTVLGAGPAGLTSAYELVKNKIPVKVYDENPFIGGLSRTQNFDGYRMDFGGHRFYTKSARVGELWEETLGPDFLLRRRTSRIYYKKKFFQYPLKVTNVLLHLGIWESIRIIASYVARKMKPHRKEQTLEQWVTNRFGDRLFQTFFKTYTEKVWGIPCTQIGADWAAQRIQNLSVGKLLLHTFFPSSAPTKSLIEQFHYPRLGPGMMWEKLAQKIQSRSGSIQLCTQLIGLCHQGGRIESLRLADQTGTRLEKVSQVISSVPLKDLVLAMEPAPPADVIRSAIQLKYRAMVVVFLVIDKETLFPDNWIYIHDPSVRVGRIQNFKNWSPSMVPDPQHTSLGLEYFCDVSDPCWNYTDSEWVEIATRELSLLQMAQQKNILWGRVAREPKAYPVYDLQYRRHVKRLRRYLDNFSNLIQVGRNGLHRYNNQDHSMLTGMMAAKNSQGHNECVWSVNTERSYYETMQVPSPKH